MLMWAYFLSNYGLYSDWICEQTEHKLLAAPDRNIVKLEMWQSRRVDNHFSTTVSSTARTKDGFASLDAGDRQLVHHQHEKQKHDHIRKYTSVAVLQYISHLFYSAFDEVGPCIASYIQLPILSNMPNASD